MMKKRVLQGNGLSIGAFELGEGERVAILLHGFPDDPSGFFPLMERLAAAGYHCFAPYMRGYGETDKGPDHNYYISELAKDAVGLANYVLPGKPLTLIGHDWGAIATMAAANLAPERFSCAVAMAVPPPLVLRANLARHPEQLRKSWYMLFFQLSFLSDWYFMRQNFAFIEKLWRDWSPGWRYAPEHLAAVKGTFRVPGTPSAALAYYRALLRPPRREHVASFKETLRLLSQPISTPFLLLAGEHDGCIGLNMYDGWQAAFKGRCRLDVIKNAGHFMQAEQPDQVASCILKFVL